MPEPKILLFDIETAPALVYTFSLFKPIIGIDQIVEPPRVICWSAKWYGRKQILYASEYEDGYAEMLRGLWELLNEADAVVGYNSDGFDIPWMNGEFAKQGWKQPAPYIKVDLWKLAKQNFRLISGKLDYLALTMVGDRKVSHEGFTLWKSCINPVDSPDKAAAWKRMKAYGIKDTVLLEPLFELLRPMMRNLNYGLWAEPGTLACTHCGSTDVQKRGFRRTTAGVFQRYQCNEDVCGGWSTDPKRVSTTGLRPL